ncbi:MAG: hypothetical protein LQ352_003884 [Teloschistes flavicans]|nr:MAG: hypothetical protein LQ352_003884 [Teloschistes flavicans]
MSAKLTQEDFTYNLARLAIVTDLEPLLGIIVACAPLFPPTIKAALAWRRGSQRGTSGPFSNFAKLNNSKGSQKAKRPSADDSYHLTDVQGRANEIHITSPHSQQSSFHEGNEAELGEGLYKNRTITVKKGWEIKTHHAQ